MTDLAETATTSTPANYSATAPGYAEFWSPAILPAGRRLLGALRWDRVTRILDVGTGTGALIPEMRRLAPAASIIGVDPALGMLARARSTGASLAAMDAMALGLRAGAFDVAVLAFVLFHVPDPSAALAEVRRALRRHGRVGVTTWAEDLTTPAIRIWDDELGDAGAWDPHPQLTRDELMNSPEKVRDLLGAAGFAPERVWLERVTYQWSVGRYMGLRTGFGATKRKLGTLDPEARQACLDRIEARTSRLSAADLLGRGTAIYATAVDRGAAPHHAELARGTPDAEG